MLIEHVARADMLESDIEQCYKLVRVIRPLYLASGSGWSRKLKLQEFSDPRLHFLLIRQEQPQPQPPKSDRQVLEFTNNESSNQIVAFLSFIPHDSSLDSPCVYIYEVHVSRACRAKGLGKALMNELEFMIRESNLKTHPLQPAPEPALKPALEPALEHMPSRINLTVFDFNVAALDFYKKLGYKVVEEYPQRRLEMSKVLTDIGEGSAL